MGQNKTATAAATAKTDPTAKGDLGDTGAPGPTTDVSVQELNAKTEAPAPAYDGSLNQMDATTQLIGEINDEKRLLYDKPAPLRPLNIAPEIKPGDKNEEVLAEKPGHEGRTFTRLQLESMGIDDNGETYDGWKITNKPVTPAEVAEEPTAAEKAVDALADAIKA